MPDEDASARAKERLAIFLPDARDVAVKVNEHVEFVPAMGNFESVLCPECGSLLDNNWWAQAMDATYGDDGFANLDVKLPCCGAIASLNDLDYRWPQGFARFVLTAFEPNAADLEDCQMAEIEEILRCKLRKVWAHM